MDKQFDNRNTFTLGKNDKKTEDWHKEYRGKLSLDIEQLLAALSNIGTSGTLELFLDADIRQGPTGKFFSGKAKPKGGWPASKAEQSMYDDAVDRTYKTRGSLKDQLDDDVPF
jgi:hypothetical protein